MAASNMSIQTTAEPSYMDRPSMKQDSHPEHNMPDSEHNGTKIQSRYGDDWQDNDISTNRLKSNQGEYFLKRGISGSNKMDE